MNSHLAKDIYRKRLIIEGEYTTDIHHEKFVHEFLIDLAKELQMTVLNGPFISSATGGVTKSLHDGYEGAIIWAESGASTYIWTRSKFATIDIYTCRDFDTQKAIKFCIDYFKIKKFSWQEIPDSLAFNEDSRIEVRETENKGSAMFAKDFIPANTTLSYTDGQILFAEKESEVTPFAKDYAIPFHKKFYRNGFNSSAVKYNHSCDPNCYVKDLFFVTTMRDVQPGEELTYSYSLFCNSDWQNPEGKCFCGASNCHGKILPWRDLPKDEKIKYLPYTADWILFEEMKANGFLDTLKNAL